MKEQFLSMKKSLIMGKNCLKEVLKAQPNRFKKIFTSKQDDPILSTAKKYQIPIQYVSKPALSAIVQSNSHQGFVAHLKERDHLSIKDFLRKVGDQSLVLMCDGITDPQNFGAILRAAECFGVDGVIFSKNRGVDITPVVSKASVGASEIVPLLRVSNLAISMKAFQDRGFTAIVADVSEIAKSLETVVFPQKTLLIVGSEGSGVQPLIRRKADFSVKIPLKGQIDSLNVSQAVSILLLNALGSSSPSPLQ